MGRPRKQKNQTVNEVIESSLENQHGVILESPKSKNKKTRKKVDKNNSKVTNAKISKLYVNKTDSLKIPPRSCLQFKVGPPFRLIKNYNRIIKSSDGNKVIFNLTPRIDRGFDYLENQWIGYKRNYFAVTSSFQSSIEQDSKFVQDTFNITFDINQEEPLCCTVKYFAINLYAKDEAGINNVALVQHTAKRDKGPHFQPKPCPVIQSKLPDHDIIRSITNIKSLKKTSSLDKLFHFYLSEHGIVLDSKEEEDRDPLYIGYPGNCLDKVARFERIQFACSSGINRLNSVAKRFQLYVSLGVVIEMRTALNLQNTPGIQILDKPDSDSHNLYFVNLVDMTTPPLIIRGRSPSNYGNITSKTSNLRANTVDPLIEKAVANIDALEESSPIKVKKWVTPKRQKVMDQDDYPKHNTINKRSKTLPGSISSEISVTMLQQENIDLSNITSSSPVKLNSPLLPHLLKRKMIMYSNIENGRPSQRVQTLDQLEKEVTEKRVNIGELDREYTKEIVSLPIKDIEIKTKYKIQRENVVLMGSLLYSPSGLIFNSQRYNQGLESERDIDNLISFGEGGEDGDSESSVGNTNELSATNITFSHVIEQQQSPDSYKPYNRSQLAIEYTPEHKIPPNIALKNKLDFRQNENYIYNSYHPFNRSLLDSNIRTDDDQTKPSSKCHPLSSASDNLLLKGMISSDRILDDSKYNEF